MGNPEIERDRAVFLDELLETAPPAIENLLGAPFEAYRVARDGGATRIAILNDLCVQGPETADLPAVSVALGEWSRRWNLTETWIVRSVLWTFEGWYQVPELRDPPIELTLMPTMRFAELSPELPKRGWERVDAAIRAARDGLLEGAEPRDSVKPEDCLGLVPGRPLPPLRVPHPDWQTEEQAIAFVDLLKNAILAPYKRLRTTRRLRDGMRRLVRYQVLGQGWTRIRDLENVGSASSVQESVKNAAERIGIDLRPLDTD